MTSQVTSEPESPGGPLAAMRRWPALALAWISERYPRIGAPGHPDAYHASRLRLVLVNLTVVSTIILVMAVAFYAVQDHAIDEQVNSELYDRAASLEQNAALSLLHETSELPLTPTQPAGTSLVADTDDGDLVRYGPNSPDIFIILVDKNSHPVTDASAVIPYGLPDHGALAAVVSGKVASSLVTVTNGSNQFRLYTVPLSENNQIIGAAQIGVSLTASLHERTDLLLTILAVGAGVFIMTAGASFLLADRALTPMRLAYENQRQFASAASHELRTPLAFVRSQLELVERQLARATTGKPLDAEGAVVDLRDAISEVDYMTRLVRDLLTLARDTGDGKGLSWDEIDLRLVAIDAASVVRAAAAEKDLRFIAPTTTSGSGPIIHGDRDRLRQVCLILLENAIRYTPPGGEIRLSAEHIAATPLHPEHALLSVADTGSGIAQADLPHIFEPFFRAESSRTPGPSSDETHAGLGLALARWIVQAHGGTIAVRSVIGKGTNFSISLPIHHGDAIDEDE